MVLADPISDNAKENRQYNFEKASFPGLIQEPYCQSYKNYSMTFDQSSSKIFILSGLIGPVGGMLDWLIVTATKFILINQFWISWLFENLTQRLLHYFYRRATDALAYLIFVEEHASI
jgi:hypothetical protein